MLNFGSNQKWSPGIVVAPATTEELLQVLREHRGRHIRAVGRLHSWSQVVIADDVLIDLRKMNQVVVQGDRNRLWADVGAGCQIKQLLAELQKQDLTTPTLGLITEQALAGAASTGTHGSGRHSLSHYSLAVTIAIYDPETDEPVMRVIESGDALRAARCALGMLGIVTAIRIPVRPQYHVEEHFRRYDRLEDVLAAERDFPLQQFYLAPWRWDFFAQHRREVDAPRSRMAPLYRLYWSVGMDVLLHLIVRWLARWLPRACTRFFFRRLMAWLIPQHWKVVDRSDRQLTMKHELFRHIEIEMFVRQSQLPAASDFVVQLMKFADGQREALSEATRGALATAGVWSTVEACLGQYQHHYPICIRKVLPDDTLISMSTGDEAWYALSFISYALPSQRCGFERFAAALARSTAALFGARPHWGKLCPLTPSELRANYPRWDEFFRLVREIDPSGRFRNPWTATFVD